MRVPDRAGKKVFRRCDADSVARRAQFARVWPFQTWPSGHGYKLLAMSGARRSLHVTSTTHEAGMPQSFMR
jgi:hypothetical protein